MTKSKRKLAATNFYERAVRGIHKENNIIEETYYSIFNDSSKPLGEQYYVSPTVVNDGTSPSTTDKKYLQNLVNKINSNQLKGSNNG